MSGYGKPRIATFADAAATAGAELELTGDFRYRIGSFAFRLHTAAGGGNRQVLVRLLDASGATVYAIAAVAVQAGGLDVDYSFAPNVPAFGTAALGAIGGPFPGAKLAENLTVSVTVSGAAAGDRIQEGRALVEQYRREPEPE